MTTDPSELLRRYEAVPKPRPHEFLLRAAADEGLPTDFLVREALEAVSAWLAADEDDEEADGGSYALLVLQQRVTPEVLELSLDFVRSEDAARRILGAMILREFPSLESSPYAERVVDELTEAAANEADVECLWWLLSAIGWQGLPQSIDVLLRYRDDPRASVRRTVANNLLMATEDGVPVATTVREAYLIYLQDPDPDIQWSAFWDIAEHTASFVHFRTEIEAVARRLLPGLRDDVAFRAGRALEALRESGA